MESIEFNTTGILISIFFFIKQPFNTRGSAISIYLSDEITISQLTPLPLFHPK